MHAFKTASFQQPLAANAGSIRTFNDETELVADDWLHEVVEEAGVDARVGVGGALYRQPVTLTTHRTHKAVTSDTRVTSYMCTQRTNLTWYVIQ